MRVVAVLPARWQSSRFPGKPLAEIDGIPMIVRVYQRTAQATLLDQVVVATDDQRIAALCRDWDIPVRMTAADHPTGTDRVAEIAAAVPADIYVNVQGDEPLIDPRAIDRVIGVLQAKLSDGVTVATAYRGGCTDADALNPSVVHLVTDQCGTVLTLSRAPVPHHFVEKPDRTVHVGLYAFTGAALGAFTARPRGPVERCESIELFRFLEYGDRIACTDLTDLPHSIGVDHPGDIAKVEAILKGGDGPVPAPPTLQGRLAAIRLFCTDVDGVMTDGGLYYGADGDEQRRFHVHDGLGLKALMRAGITVAVITASDVEAIRRRCAALGIHHLVAGCGDKRQAIQSLCRSLQIDPSEVSHIGDDINDLPAFDSVGVAVAVANAHPEVARRAHLRTNARGGDGAIRELADLILSARNSGLKI